MTDEELEVFAKKVAETTYPPYVWLPLAAEIARRWLSLLNENRRMRAALEIFADEANWRRGLSDRNESTIEWNDKNDPWLLVKQGLGENEIQD